MHELGSGGMASVYLARDRRHGREVAIKVLSPDRGSGVSAERFLREIRLVARLQHPHILPLFDSGAGDDGILWFAMPLVNGESLRTRLERERALHVDECLRLARQVADALDYAHARGVIHRDVSPRTSCSTACTRCSPTSAWLAAPVPTTGMRHGTRRS
jgi:serine/threonine-protein kinase